MSDETMYNMEPEEWIAVSWRGGLYVLGAAILTSLAIMLLGEVLEELFLASLFMYAGIGWAAGVAMQHTFTYSEQLPVKVLAVLFTLLGILVSKFVSGLITTLYYLGVPVGDALMMSIMDFGPVQLDTFMWIISFSDPVSSVMLLAAPLIAVAIAWRAVKDEEIEVF